MKSSATVLTLKLVAACALFGAQAQHSYADFGDQLKLLPNDGAAFDYFGETVSIDDNVAIVGANSDDAPALNSGSAYLFNATTGGQLAKLLPLDGGQEQFFGSAVGVSGNTAIVGATSAWNESVRTGAAYLFDVSTGNQTAKLTASDGAASDAFGNAVAIDGDRVIVGAREARAAYLFDTAGNQLSILANAATASIDRFAFSVGIGGDFAIAGAPYDNVDSMANSGSAYLFSLNAGGPPVRITPDDGAAGDRFGYSVAISGSIAIVGARSDQDNGSDSGSAYLFDASTGDQLWKLLPDDGVSSDFFGHSVAISGNVAIVGAIRDDDIGTNSGSAYLFDVTTGDQLAKLTASDGAAYDAFGVSVGISGNRMIVGAHTDDDMGQGSGSAYVFEGIAEFLDADFDHDNDVDGADFLAWQRGNGINSGAQHGDGDADASGSVDAADLAIWKGQFGSISSTLVASSINAVVPEPTAGRALLICLLAWVTVGRRGKRNHFPQRNEGLLSQSNETSLVC